MITKNFKSLIKALFIIQPEIQFGAFPMKNLNGVQRFAVGNIQSQSTFPYALVNTFALSDSASGISFGTGNTAEDENDYNLENTITSGINVTIINKEVGFDQYGSHFVKYTFTITNTGSEAISIKEIGYKQPVRCAIKPHRNSSINDNIFLIDRTVLDTPLTILAGDAGVLTYSIVVPEPESQKIGNLDIVPFTYGTDEQIAALIDAAHEGTVDLQTDCGWKVGDMRSVHISAFNGGSNGSIAHPEQDVTIIISSFENYENCGSVLQFDFVDTPTPGEAIGGEWNTWTALPIYNVTLPAMANALPSWLKTRLISFTVDTTVENNKLALRSSAEIVGNNNIDLYKKTENRKKWIGLNASDASQAWIRASSAGGNNHPAINTSGAETTIYRSTVSAFAAFGCL